MLYTRNSFVNNTLAILLTGDTVPLFAREAKLRSVAKGERFPSIFSSLLFEKQQYTSISPCHHFRKVKTVAQLHI